VQQQHHDRAVAWRGVLGRANKSALLVLIQRARRGPRDALTRHHGRPEAEEAVEVIGRGQREVHRARRPAPLTLQIDPRPGGSFV